MFYPFRLDGFWRENKKKPIATLESCTDFVVPFLRSYDVLFAIKSSDVMLVRLFAIRLAKAEFFDE